AGPCRASTPDGMAVQSSRQGRLFCHCRFHLSYPGHARGVPARGRGVRDLARPHPGWHVRGYQSDVRPTGSIRPAGDGARAPRILGRAGDDAAASGGRSKKTDGAVHWPLSAVSRGASGAHRRGAASVGQACIAVRNTQGIDDKNPFDFEYVKARIEQGLREFEGRYAVVPLPNISHVFYGRDVGYAVERIDLNLAIENISAAELRRRLATAH